MESRQIQTPSEGPPAGWHYQPAGGLRLALNDRGSGHLVEGDENSRL